MFLCQKFALVKTTFLSQKFANARSSLALRDIWRSPLARQLKAGCFSLLCVFQVDPQMAFMGRYIVTLFAFM